MVIWSAWLRGVLLQLEIRAQQTSTRSDSVNAESIECFGVSLYLLSGHKAAPLVRITWNTREQPRVPRAPGVPTNTQEHPPEAQRSSPGALQEHSRALEPVLLKRHAVCSSDPKSPKMILKFRDRRVGGLLLRCDPFNSNGSRFGLFGPNGSKFCRCCGKAPRAEGGKGAGNFSPLTWSCMPDLRVGGCFPYYSSSCGSILIRLSIICASLFRAYILH